MDGEHKKGFIYPDYANCNINVSGSLAEFIGAPHSAPPLPLLTRELEQKPRNIVFICFDGMGMHPLRLNLPEDDPLRRNIAAVLTSTFPSTTTCATVSIRTASLPCEHGWFGWTMYIPGIDRNVDIFRGVDSWTKQPADVTGWPLRDEIPYYDRAVTDYRVNTVFQPYMKVAGSANNRVFDSLDGLFESIYEICSRPEKQFVYAYYDSPDSIMHLCGASGEQTRSFLRRVSDGLEGLRRSVSDTLFIVTADHGHVDVGENIHIYKDEELMDTLLLYPYLEPRATAFRVKPGRRGDFERIFALHYGKYFELFPSQELIDRGLFGGKSELCRLLLGDYIAVGNYSHKIFRMSPTPKIYKGHHTSLTEEMEVPLILVRS